MPKMEADNRRSQEQAGAAAREGGMPARAQGLAAAGGGRNPGGGASAEGAAAGAGRGFAGVAAVRHAVDILRAMDGSGPDLGVNELARRAGVHNSTASRILSTLEAARFVDRDPLSGRFRIGMGLIALVNPIVTNLDIVQLARPAINRLAREAGETTSLGFWLEGEVIMVEQVPGSRAVGFITRASARVPAHCTAAGKMFLSEASPAERQQASDRFRPLGIQSILSR